MNPRGLRIAVLAGSLAGVAAMASAAEVESQWPGWRGPLGNGVAPRAVPPVTWDTQKNIRWKIEVPGRGSATPVVWGDRLFVLTAVPVGPAAAAPAEESALPADGQRPRRGGRGDAPVRMHRFLVLCYDRHTGNKLWEQTAIETVPHEGTHNTNNYAPSSPVTDGAHLYVSFGSRGVYCYTLDGELKWKRDLGRMQTRNAFGEGGSPALHQGRLVVPFDHEGQSFYETLDAATGRTLWKVDRDEPTIWATPFIVEHEGVTQVIAHGTRRVRSYDLADGRLIWECGGQTTNPIPTPLVWKDRVYCLSGYRGYAVYAIPLSSRGDLTGTDRVAWHRTDSGPYVSSPVLYGDQLYYTKSQSATMSVVRADNGETILGETRLPELTTLYASPVAADGRVYFTDRAGTTVVLKHGPTLQVLAINKLGETIDASPVLVDRRMYLRGERHLYCIEER